MEVKIYILKLNKYKYGKYNLNDLFKSIVIYI